MRARILLVLGFVLLLPGAAHAVNVTVDACEPVEIRGVPLHRLTLAFTSDAFAISVLLDGRAQAVPYDTCRVLTATAPAGWFTTVTADGRVVFDGSGGVGGFPAGTPVGGFQVVFNHPNACVEVTFLDESGVVQTTEACFADCEQTPALARSWGSLKAAYR